MNYLLDTNIVTAIIKGDPHAVAQFLSHSADVIFLCPPVYFESMRGLVWKKALIQIAALQTLQSQLGWIPVIEQDWTLATQLWVNTVSRGRQLDDIDLLIAALAIRQNAIIVSADKDFDALPVSRETWR